MRPKILIPLALAALVGTLAGGAAAARPSPALAAKRAEAAQVLQQVATIDERLSVITERFDGARVTLDALRRRLAGERVSLARARRQNRRAELQVAKVLVSLYTSTRPTALDAILGAASISTMMDVADAENRISREDAHVAIQAQQARQHLEGVVHSLESDRAAAALAVSQLARARAEVERGLAQRRTLLASVQAQITQIEAQERARQERLAAEARARLAAEEAAAQARLAAERKAAAAAAAARASAARAQTAATANVSTTTTTPAAATTPATTAPVPAPTPAFAPALLPAGHTAAAQIALEYIGVPYLWGGASPTGFDCSGLVTYVFAQLGIALPHYAAAQYGFGVPVPQADLQPGDLVFFDNLDHVGIYIGQGQFVDAPHTGTFVRIDSLSDPWYASRYVGAQRI